MNNELKCGIGSPNNHFEQARLPAPIASAGDYRDSTIEAFSAAGKPSIARDYTVENAEQSGGDEWTEEEREVDAICVEDAALFRALVAHTWEFNTSFDKESQPTMTKAVFKITTSTGDSMRNDIRTLVKDFGKNADALDEGR